MLRQLIVIPGLLLGILGLVMVPSIVTSSQHPQSAESAQIDILSLSIDH